jgi:hypothetical protein
MPRWLILACRPLWPAWVTAFAAWQFVADRTSRRKLAFVAIALLALVACACPPVCLPVAGSGSVATPEPGPVLPLGHRHARHA